MTICLDRLEGAGLVRRLPDPDDRRGVLVQLTDPGLRLEKALTVQAEKEALFASALTKRERDQPNCSCSGNLMLAFEKRGMGKERGRLSPSRHGRPPGSGSLSGV